MTGNCHCGAVSITLAHKPDYMFDCNCSVCSRQGVLWGYFAVADVEIAGETKSYTRADRAKPNANVHFCGTCGCTTHWSPTRHNLHNQMGANMRLFDADALVGITLHFPDGAAWSGEGPFGMRRETTVF